MPLIRKFQFDQSFDEGADLLPPPAAEPEIMAPPEPPPPPEPSFTLSEVQEQIRQASAAAHAAGVEEGRVRGRTEAETETSQALAAALGRVQQSLGALMQAQSDEMALRRDNTVRIALGAVAKLLPAYVQQHGLAEVEAVVGTFLGELADEPKLTIRVHGQWLEALRANIDALATRQGFGGSVSVLADPKLGPLDVKADWGTGGAERDVTRLWADIDRIAGSLLGGRTPFAGS
ncbi:FliH/SctL family protein [Oleisolibacter albus]|uniref:FliH/SctL family protein n=1 Tax=Oleisolibacter albus TaxID=2171757 RepID=UPI000DF27D0F|nr:FliH/SctL family protein [Oleisolibacter albus]